MEEQHRRQRDLHGRIVEQVRAVRQRQQHETEFAGLRQTDRAAQRHPIPSKARASKPRSIP
jgi:hypothetical protein